MAWVSLALGFVLFVEGLVFALAPLRLEEMLAALHRLSPRYRRAFGLGAMVLGLALVALGRSGL